MLRRQERLHNQMKTQPESINNATVKMKYLRKELSSKY